MAYTFPTYPQYFPQYQQVGTQMSSPQNNGLIWVQGIEAARAYPIAPNTNIALWDSESQSIYIKSADASGMPSMRILDYTIRQESARTVQNAISGTGDTTPTRQDLNSLQEQIDALKRQIAQMGGARNESTLHTDESRSARRNNAKA